MTRMMIRTTSTRQAFARRSVPRRFGAIDWVIPAVAMLGLGLAALAAMGAGDGQASPDSAGLVRAAIVPVSGPAEPGAPRVAQRLDTASGAIDRCDAVSGQCRALPVEDTAYRMSDGSEWVARTAYDDRGQVEYTLWYDARGQLVGAPLGL
ncbi:hypothetical protein [Pararhodobacter sp.]|uniref:hypothetical protein n=1 Tax=Pararhodobacter sp. TaxID=2127056 RepID=UPI002FE2CB3F